MRINDNGIYRDMTQEELAEYYDAISAAQGGNARSPADTGVQTCCDWIETLPYSELITGKENN